MPSLANVLRTSPLRSVYEALPPRVRRLYRRLVHGPSHLAWRVHPRGRARAHGELASLYQRFGGHRAVVLGNGPSLRRTDLSTLSGEFVIGTNRIYLLAKETGLSVDLYVSVNHLVLRQFCAEIRAFEAPLKLIDWRHGRRFFAADPNAVFLPEVPDGAFREDIRNGWSHGYTVTFSALQAAFHLGFSEVILVGVDHRFRARGVPMREVTASGPDADHFSAEYFGRGVRWQLPNLQGSEASYRAARASFESRRRRILDATVDGALGVFPKVTLAGALQDSPFPPASWREVAG